MKDEKKILEILFRIKKISGVYRKASNLQKDMLFEKSLFLVDDLIDEGYSRDFTESLVMFGKEFLELSSVKEIGYYRTKYPEAFIVFEVS